MKRLFILLMCLILTLSAAPAFAAGIIIYTNASDDGQSSLKDTLQYAAYAGGAAYIFTMDSSGFLAVTDAGERIRYTWEEGTVSDYGEDTLLLQSAFGHEDTLYALLIRMRHSAEDNTQRVRGAFLYDVTLDRENHTAGLGDRVKLDWNDMIEDMNGGEYSRAVAMPFVQDGKFVFMTYGGSGGSEAAVYDMETGDGERMNIENFSSIASYKDGMALVLTSDINSSPAKYAFSTLDLNTGALSMLVEKEMPDLVRPTHFLYDAKTDNLYYRMGGEFWVAQGMRIDTARSIGVASGYGSITSQLAMTNDGYLFAPDGEFVMKYFANPDAGSSKTIRVTDWGDITQKSALSLGEKHPDVEVVMDPNSDGIIEAMMNRSDFVDVYCVDMMTSDYMALYNRVFMEDLSSSDIISKTTGEMYPAIQKAITKDGKILALPISIFTSTLGYSPEGFKAMGLSDDDVPKTWVEFFTLLKDLTGEVDDNNSVTMFDSTSSVSEMRVTLIENLLSSYLLYLGSDEAGNMSFDSPVLREILNAFDQVSFEDMNLDEDRGSSSYTDQGSVSLFSTWAPFNVAVSGFAMARSMVLALNDELPPFIQSEITVMFVNPFSSNQQLAREFVECAAGKLDNMFLTNACPNRNDPIESTIIKSLADEMERTLADMEKALEKADEDNAIVIESNIKLIKAQLEDYRTNWMYDASQQSIADYRKYAGFIRAGTSFGIDIKDSPDIATAIRQYADKAINAEAFIRNIDQRLRMMMLEGA